MLLPAFVVSALFVLRRRGIWVGLLAPDGGGKTTLARALAGERLTVHDFMDEGVEGAAVIYAKSWAATAHYGDDLADQSLREQLISWCVDETWFDNAKPEGRFMHCLPVRRGVVVQDHVLDSPRSVVIHEARNRMVAQMAVLHQLMNGSG